MSRHYLLRDAYDDMVLDGVKPERDTFHSLIAGSMRGACLQDAFFFRDEMKTMGLVPDVISFLSYILASICPFILSTLLNCIVSTKDIVLIVALAFLPSPFLQKLHNIFFLLSHCESCFKLSKSYHMEEHNS